MRQNKLFNASIREKRFFLIVLFICSLVSITAGQANRDTDKKADSNLKSSARINPSTLAMELSIPFISYSGRAGNSVPVAIRYSSKLWTMRQSEFKRFDGVSGYGTQQYPYLVTYITSFLPEFGERTVGGWSSDLQPIYIIPEVETFDGNGFSAFGRPESENLLEDPSNCIVRSRDYIDTDAMCPGGRITTTYVCETESGQTTIVDEVCYSSPFDTGGGGGGGGGGGPRVVLPNYRVKRLRLQMPDGSNVEFRKDDKLYDCNVEPCGSVDGNYFSTNGSRMRLVIQTQNNQRISTLFMPDGGRYIFDVFGTTAQQYIDRNGNQTTYDPATRKWIDTLGRGIVNPLPSYAENTNPQTFSYLGLNGQNQNFTEKWKKLKPDGCTTGSESSCLESALENQSDSIYNIGTDDCTGGETDHSLSPSLFQVDPPHVETTPNQNNVFYRETYKQRTCGELFNPSLLTEIVFPDGSKYQFRYNRYGEMTKIIYPTGAYERFRYEAMPQLAPIGIPPYAQTGRGVAERWVSSDGINEEQHWQYNTQGGFITTIAPDNTKSRRLSFIGSSGVYFEDPRAGMPVEEQILDSNGDIRSRTINDWIVTGPQGVDANFQAQRDARLKRSVSISIEGEKALATLTETDYEVPGQNGAPSDLTYFAHLNPKQTRSTHFVEISKSTAIAANLSWATLENLFANVQTSSLSQTDYLYDANYNARGIPSLPVETRVLNPNNPSEVLARTQTVYDQYDFAASGNLPGSLANTWVNPLNDATIPSNSQNLRGNPTTSVACGMDNNQCVQTHTQFDQYGNPRKVWEPNENPATSLRFAETEYSADYAFAYPTKVITPAPDPSGTHGTDQGSFATTVYDYMSGLLLSATNEFGQTTATEYDNILRPIRSYAVNFSAPEARTEYGVPDSSGQFPANQRFVKVRKQIDATNWDEAITWFDSLGRTIKKQAKDSQGDVFTETKFDYLGRVKWTSNPYRMGDSKKYWSRPRYDEIGRVYESCAPVADDSQTPLNFDFNGACPSGTSLGVTSFSISTVPEFVGTVVTSTDASGRKSRSITNALGQLLRVDEATATGGAVNTDLGDISTPSQPTFYNYSPQGKMVKVKQGKPGDQYIQYRYFLYDSLGRLIRVRQPEQDVNSPGLDKTDPITGNNQWTAAFTYDVLGNVLTATDANGTVIENTYDKANRITTKTYTPGQNISATPPVEYFYDGKCNPDQTAACFTSQSPNYAKGKLTQVKSTVSETRYTEFDYLGRLKKMEQRTPVTGETLFNAPARVSSYEYNFSGALVKETYPSGRVVQNEFEADGDLSRIYGKASHSTAVEQTYANSFTYTADGKIEKLRLGNRRWEWAKFNERLQVKELALGYGTTDASLWDLKYDYGELESNGVDVNFNKNTGNIAKQTLNFAGLANPLVQTFKYDSLYRLTEAKETDGAGTNAPRTWQENFTYDRFGNRESGTHQKITGETSIALNSLNNPTIDKNKNRIDSPYYHYDKNGNLTDDAEGRTFVFNGENKQKFVVQSGNNVGEYFYDGEGNRVKKKVYEANGITVKEETVFVYSSGKLVAEYSTKIPSTNPTTSYTGTDLLESPRVITDSLGNVVSRRDFMPFGEEITNNIGERVGTNLKYNASDSVRQKFTGYQKDDETGLDFAEARMYENRHGRFTAVDPLLASGKSADPQTFNRYVYVSNNPLVLTDPTGMQQGRWYQPREPGKPIWVRNNETASDDYVEVSSRNKAGQLIAPIPGSDDFVVRFNENGPVDSTKILVSAPRLGIYSPQLSHFQYYGWEYVLSDSFLEKVNNDPNPGLVDALNPLEAALFFSPMRGTSSGASFSTRATSGFSTYARRDAAIRAEVALDEFTTLYPKMNRAMTIGAAPIKGNAKIAMVNGPVPLQIGARSLALATRLGGIGAKVPCGGGSVITVGRCAEFRAVNFLELRYGTNPNEVMFTQPLRQSSNQFRPVCCCCSQIFPSNQFPPGTQRSQ